MQNSASWFHVGVVISLFCIVAAPGQQPLKEARSIPLVCAGGDCSLLTGVPQTAGMHSGFVRLAPNRTVGRHTTGKKEETLVILHGQGDALLDGGKKLSFVAPAVVYFPPSTFHDVLNTGKDLLEYVYVVAPATGQ
jgi:mannose-6-phosphate isomerase-like protein (cupin superfamily)